MDKDKANEKEIAEAKSAEDKRAAESGAGDSGIKPDEKVDVSDDAMAKARVAAAAEENAEKVTDDNADKKSDDDKKSSEEADDVLDEISQAILSEIDSTKPDEQHRQTLEEENKELKRKNEKLMKGIQSDGDNKTDDKVVGNIKTQKEYYEWAEKEYGYDQEEFDKQMKFSKALLRDTVLPELDRLKAELSRERLGKTLEKDKIYSVMKEKVDDLVKNDPIISTHPDEKARYLLAIQRVKMENLPKIIEAVKKKEAARVSKNKRVIPVDRSSAGDNKVKSKDSSFDLSDSLSKQNMKRMDISQEDVDKYSGALILED